MLVSEMRDTIVSHLHNGGNGYSSAERDRAFRLAANEFIWRTNVTRKSTTFVTVSGTRVYNLVTANVDYLAKRFLRAEIDYEELKPVSYEVLARGYADGTGGSGEPTHFAQMLDTEFYLSPIPDAVYTVKVYYREPLTIRSGSPLAPVTWTMGSADAGVTGAIINIPDEYITGIIQWGATPALVASAPNVLLRNGEWGYYIQWMLEAAGDADADGAVYFADDADFIG